MEEIIIGSLELALVEEGFLVSNRKQISVIGKSLPYLMVFSPEHGSILIRVIDDHVYAHFSGVRAFDVSLSCPDSIEKLICYLAEKMSKSRI